MENKRRGSIFLMALGTITVLFIIGFSITFFTGSEDYASSLSYESEVAFNLAESAVEEFVVRLKNSMNNDDPNNQLYKVLRSNNFKEDEDIPLDAQQVARLTSYSRETARQIYGIQLGSGNSNSKQFAVEAKLKLKRINPVQARAGSKSLYTIKERINKEKQGELLVTARVSYKARTAKMTLSFLIRVVKVFVPPFNYFTLYVKDGTAFGGSDFNPWESHTGEQTKNVWLDNGWSGIKKDFDATKDVDLWEKTLVNDLVPPGRVYLGQDPNAQLPPSIFLQSTNGAKLHSDNPTDKGEKFTHINCGENLFMKYDIDWKEMKNYVKEDMVVQGQDKTKEGWLFTGWKNIKIRVRNVGAGYELIEDKFPLGEPSFFNAMSSFQGFRKFRINTPSSIPKQIVQRLYPEIDRSGLDLFGFAPPLPKGAPPKASGGAIDTTLLSPTIVYGPVWRMYYRVVTIKKPEFKNVDGGKTLELPFIGTEPPGDGSPLPIPLPMGIKRGDKMNASQALMLFSNYKLPPKYLSNFITNWDDFPKGLKEIEKYENFMSNSGLEPYNMGLGNFINRIKDEKKIYDGPLKEHLIPFMANEPYTGMPSQLANAVAQSPMQEHYQGDLWHALPDEGSAYLMDFFFIPRSTEDFFRGRKTISVGGSAFDRFTFKYINDARRYLDGVKGQTLELSGILALNDPDTLDLKNLTFRGRGVIYSSPMMGGGAVRIIGDFFPAAAMSGSNAVLGSNPNHDLITIVAPSIVIETDTAANDPCYVEANLISVTSPILVKGSKNIKIRGSVACPYLEVGKSFQTPNGGAIMYNPLNSIWQSQQPQLLDKMYIAKIVTGGVGKFDWNVKFE